MENSTGKARYFPRLAMTSALGGLCGQNTKVRKASSSNPGTRYRLLGNLAGFVM